MNAMGEKPKGSVGPIFQMIVNPIAPNISGRRDTFLLIDSPRSQLPAD